MRELTILELDAQLAEQLPARELMGRYCGPTRSYCPHQVSQTTNVFQGNVGSGNGNGNHDGNGLIPIASGNLDGNFNGDSINVL